MGGRDDEPRVIRVDDWSVEGGWTSRRRRVPMIGAFLIVLGVLLAAGQFFSAAQLGASAFFLAVGLVLVLMGIRDHSDLSLYTGAFVGALALSDLLSGAGVIHGSGWGTLFLGIAILAIALFRAARGARPAWSFVIGGLLVLWGGSTIVTASLSFDADRLVGPLLIILLGAFLVGRSFGRSRY